MLNYEDFKNLVYKWAEKIGVKEKIKSIQIRSLKSKIASCSSKGRLTFDYSILSESEEKINHIIVHELLHLRYKNHGALFKKMEKYYLNAE